MLQQKLAWMLTASLLLSACGGGGGGSDTNGDSTPDPAASAFVETPYTFNTSEDGSTIYQAELSMKGSIAYSKDTVVYGDAGISISTQYKLTKSALLITPATLTSDGQALSFVSITESPSANTQVLTLNSYNTDLNQTAGQWRMTLEKKDVSGLLLADYVDGEIASTDNYSNSLTTLRNSGATFPAGSVIYQMVDHQKLEDYLPFDNAEKTAFTNLPDWQAAQEGEFEWREESWANYTVLFNQYDFGAVVYNGSVYEVMLHPADASPEDTRDAMSLYLNKTAADAMAAALADFEYVYTEEMK